ncbi:transposase [Actinocorallia populi]|uniref:transposase n=1 Tax=Actinocorallia populi TaxID=2079200 RepID=UPI0018E5292E
MGGEVGEHLDVQATARAQAATDPAWQDAYRRWRPPVERVIAWLAGHGNSRLRYHETIKNNAWLLTAPPPSTSAA